MFIKTKVGQFASLIAGPLLGLADICVTITGLMVAIMRIFVAHSDSEPGHQYVSPARASPITQLISDDGSIIATLLNNTLGNAADRCGFVQTRFRLIVS